MVVDTLSRKMSVALTSELCLDLTVVSPLLDLIGGGGHKMRQ